jgi:hypothetical protein
MKRQKSSHTCRQVPARRTDRQQRVVPQRRSVIGHEKIFAYRHIFGPVFAQLDTIPLGSVSQNGEIRSAFPKRCSADALYGRRRDADEAGGSGNCGSLRRDGMRREGMGDDEWGLEDDERLVLERR